MPSAALGHGVAPADTVTSPGDPLARGGCRRGRAGMGSKDMTLKLTLREGQGQGRQGTGF